MLTHLRLPDGANVIRLPAVETIADSIDLAARHSHAVVVHGAFGSGKYTATLMALDALRLAPVELDLEPGMSSRSVVRRLHASLIGHDDVSERDLQDDVVEALAADSRPVLVRHCDRLTREGSGQLHWLHNHPNAHFPLILVGGPSTGRTIRADAHLAGSVLQTVEVTPLHDRAVLDTIPALHMLLAGADPDLLMIIDRQICRGLIRNWVTFLTVALYEREKIIARGAQPPVLGKALATIAARSMPSTIKSASSA